MEKDIWKPGAMLNPVPAVMVSCGDINGKTNIITIAWTGTVCTIPPMLSISVRKHRYSYGIIKESGKFVVNLVPQSLVRQADWCGVRSGRDFDKFQEMKLTATKAQTSNCPVIEECPVNIECTVDRIIELGSHDMFLARIDSVSVDRSLIDSQTGALDLGKAHLAAYCHGEYMALGSQIGKFGFSVKKKKKKGN